MRHESETMDAAAGLAPKRLHCTHFLRACVRPARAQPSEVDSGRSGMDALLQCGCSVPGGQPLGAAGCHSRVQTAKEP